MIIDWFLALIIFVYLPHNNFPVADQTLPKNEQIEKNVSITITISTGSTISTIQALF